MTKIIATISKNSYTPEKIEKILLAGATVLRFNFAHGTPQDRVEKIKVAREVIEKLGLASKVKILADLPGNKLRLGKFPEDTYEVEQGEELLFCGAESSPGAKEYIPINGSNIGDFVRVGEEISFGDGEIGFVVTKIIDSNNFKAKALNTRALFSEKGVNLGQMVDSLDHITDNTRLHIKHIPESQPDWVAFSFVQSTEDIKKLKALLQEAWPEGSPKIIAKIESRNGVDNIDEIIQAVDMVMIARGDLGLTVPYERLGLIQKYIIKKTKKAGKKVIVATQILDSLLDSHIPSRAEIGDLTSIVLEGADAIMMAKETGISATPEHSVAVAKKIINAVEKGLG